MSPTAPDRRYQRAGWWQSWLVSGQPEATIAPRLRASALLRWCAIAVVAFVATADPPRVHALIVVWLALVSLYNALGQYGSDAVTGRSALRLARGLVVADMAAIAALSLVYRGALPESLTACWLLVLLEALVWFDWRGVLPSIAVIGGCRAALDLVDRIESARGGFLWRDFLGDLLMVVIVAAALVLALRVLAAAVQHSRTAVDESGAADDEALRIRLSAREKEVLALISAGCSNRMIATRLHLAPSTVKTHVESILAQLDARNRAEAVAIASRTRLLADAPRDAVGVAESAGQPANARPGILLGRLSRRS